MTDALHMTRKAYQQIRRDYRTVIEGQPYTLRLDDRQGTRLVPVQFTDAAKGGRRS